MTAPAMETRHSTPSEAQTVRFMFDPACPWAWRTSQWIREARKRRPIRVEWGLYSLEYANRKSTDERYRSSVRKSRVALRLLYLAREEGGEEAIDKLYLALGRARHERGEQLDRPAVLESALTESGLDSSLLDRAQVETELDDTLRSGYEALEATGAFGVPTLYFGNDTTPYFGPVIDPVPADEEAAKLWDNLSGIAQRPYFFELKRPRG